jgi:tetratricopeptide (TPR) repeat protein
MNTTMVTCRALFALLMIASFSIPVSAYSSDATKMYNTGQDLTASGNYSGAVAAYNNAITLEPSYYEAWDGLADAYNRNGQVNDALAASNRSLEIHPEYAEGWINRGQILYNLGYWYENEAHDTTTADALYTEQLTAFEKAIAFAPNNAEAWFNKGYALAGMQRYDEAIAAFDQVKVIDPSYPNLQKNRQIAVQLRDMAGGSPATTEPAGQATALKTTSPESSEKQPVGTSARPVPLSGVAGIIAVSVAGILILQRK